ncbi:hypothetical protein BDV97DRAFT_176957 [Delphinella strobiligena]|nr:hypothetical protein BDV97DRAFT_176957 [Delphinella strobiligena]
MLEHCNFSKIENVCLVIVSHFVLQFSEPFPCRAYSHNTRPYYHTLPPGVTSPVKSPKEKRTRMSTCNDLLRCTLPSRGTYATFLVRTLFKTMFLKHASSIAPLISLFLPSVKHTPRRMTPNTPNRDENQAKDAANLGIMPGSSIVYQQPSYPVSIAPEPPVPTLTIIFSKAPEVTLYSDSAASTAFNHRLMRLLRSLNVLELALLFRVIDGTAPNVRLFNRHG